MATAAETMILTDGNREAFEKVIHVNDADDQGNPVNSEPVRLFIYGPRGSGKSTLALAKADEPNLLSKKRLMFTHGAEIMFFITQPDMEQSDEFLGNVGEADYLLLDGFETFFDGMHDFGPQVPRHLLGARDEAGLSTIVFSNASLEELPADDLEGVFDKYEILPVEPLDDAGLLEYARRAVKKAKRSDAVQITDEALEYVTLEFSKTAQRIAETISFLLDNADFPDDFVIDVEAAKQALNQE